jgi:hypothetical protein
MIEVASNSQEERSDEFRRNVELYEPMAFSFRPRTSPEKMPIVKIFLDLEI